MKNKQYRRVVRLKIKSRRKGDRHDYHGYYLNEDYDSYWNNRSSLKKLSSVTRKYEGLIGGDLIC